MTQPRLTRAAVSCMCLLHSSSLERSEEVVFVLKEKDSDKMAFSTDLYSLQYSEEEFPL